MLTEEFALLTEENDFLTERFALLTEENDFLTEEFVFLTEENAVLTERFALLTEENTARTQKSRKICLCPPPVCCFYVRRCQFAAADRRFCAIINLGFGGNRQLFFAIFEKFCDLGGNLGYNFIFMNIHEAEKVLK